MQVTHEGLQDRSSQSLFPSLGRRRRSSGPPLALLVVLVGGVIAAGLGWLSLRPNPASELPATAASAANPSGARTADLPSEATPLPLPPLAASDVLVRQLLATLSAHPEWAVWIVPENLVRRFVRSIVAVSRGSIPATQVGHLAPRGPFSVQRSGSSLVIGAASFARYDRLTETFVSLDTGSAAQLYARLHPLFEEAYAELGISERDFDTTMALAIANLLAVQLPVGPAEVRAEEAGYAFTDRRLEGATPAQKQLLRVGPANARLIQAKLTELSREIGIQLP